MPRRPSPRLLAQPVLLVPLALLAAVAPAPAEAQAGPLAHGAPESAGSGGATGPSAGGSFGSGGTTSGNAAAPKMFPDSNGSLHWNIQSDPPASSGKKAAKPIIAAEG